MSTDPILRIEDLWVRVRDRRNEGSRPAVRGLSLDIPRGATTCVVGQSGAGKTLLLRSALGITTAQPGITGGRLRFVPSGSEPVEVGFGRVRQKPWRAPLPGLRPGWANYIFQHPHEALDPFRSVESQVSSAVRVAHRGLRGRQLRSRVLEWLERVQLRDVSSVATLHPHELSGGMAQRVAIAIALATEPELLVADEPTSGLDWSIRREIVDLLGQLSRDRGMSLVLISHDFQIVEHVADRVAVMYRGDLVEEGGRGDFFAPGPGRHPYSEELQRRAALLDSGSVGTERFASLVVRQDEAPGCRFAACCPRLQSDPAPEYAPRCRSLVPPERLLRDDHRVRCLAVEEPTQ